MQESGLSIPEIAKMVSPAVVGVVADSGTAVYYGSGIILSENGYLVTNAHVIEDGTGLSIITKDVGVGDEIPVFAQDDARRCV